MAWYIMEVLFESSLAGPFDVLAQAVHSEPAMRCRFANISHFYKNTTTYQEFTSSVAERITSPYEEDWDQTDVELHHWQKEGF